MSQAFNRFFKLQERIQDLKNKASLMGVTLPHDQAVLQAGEYKSRGHGKGVIGKNYFTSSSKYLPHDGKKQYLRAGRQNLANVVVNGFELIQRVA